MIIGAATILGGQFQDGRGQARSALGGAALPAFQVVFQLASAVLGDTNDPGVEGLVVRDALAPGPHLQEQHQGQRLGHAYRLGVLSGDAVNLGDLVGDVPAVRPDDQIQAGDRFERVQIDQRSGQLHNVRLARVVGRILEQQQAVGFGVVKKCQVLRVVVLESGGGAQRGLGVGVVVDPVAGEKVGRGGRGGFQGAQHQGCVELAVGGRGVEQPQEVAAAGLIGAVEAVQQNPAQPGLGAVRDGIVARYFAAKANRGRIMLFDLAVHTGISDRTVTDQNGEITIWLRGSRVVRKGAGVVEEGKKGEEPRAMELAGSVLRGAGIVGE